MASREDRQAAIDEIRAIREADQAQYDKQRRREQQIEELAETLYNAYVKHAPVVFPPFWEDLNAYGKDPWRAVATAAIEYHEEI